MTVMGDRYDDNGTGRCLYCDGVGLKWRAVGFDVCKFCDGTGESNEYQ